MGIRAPNGWPLCLGRSGVIVHLGPLAPALVRNRECYLCVRSRSAPGLEVALVSRIGGALTCRTLLDHQQQSDVTTMAAIETCMQPPPELPDQNLPELLQNLLVSVEHAIQRVPLDDLAYPCQQCHLYMPLTDKPNDNDGAASCACSCSCKMSQDLVVVKKDTSIQTSPMFEFAGAIPHIDSDEDEDKESWRSAGNFFICFIVFDNILFFC